MGYWVFLNYVPSAGDAVEVFVSHTVKDEVPRLYGFRGLDELECFELLVSAPGVGPSTALSVLCAMEPADVYRALGTSGRPEDLSDAVSGVGPKSAQRMAAALGDKVPSVPGPQASPAAGSDADSAIGALERMGFSRSEASAAVTEALRSCPEGPAAAGAPDPVGDLVAAALATL